MQHDCSDLFIKKTKVISHLRYRKTFHLLEGIVFLILIQPLWTHFAGESVITSLLMFSGLFSKRIRQASWFAILFVSFLWMFRNPIDTNSYILGLSSVYILFNANIIRIRPFIPGLIVLSLLFFAQGYGVYSAPQHFRTFLQVLSIDSLLIILSIIFRKQFLGLSGTKNLPVIDFKSLGLSEKEIQIVFLLWGDQTSKEIAYILGVTDGTIRTILSQISKKFDVLDMKEFFALQFSHKIILQL
ncbi:MAG TPA: LuxR C-terminal-related transcriptional regulator [Treponemataceae bacterium]|nr:LuxR C-terminal-related transcriptional regulator [Treponemataceae bacterium]